MQVQDPSLTSSYYPIARTREYIDYRPGHPALALIDIDVKGMPPNPFTPYRGILPVCLPAVTSVLPELGTSGHVVRRSTSSCLKRSDTGVIRLRRSAHLRARRGRFGYRTVPAHIGRTLLATRLWLDDDRRWRAAPETLACRPDGVCPGTLGVRRRPHSRKTTHPGPGATTRGRSQKVHRSDTIAACPPLQIAEKAKLDELYAAELHRLAPERAKARSRFIDERAKRLTARTGAPIEASRRTIERQIEGILLSEIKFRLSTMRNSGDAP